MTNSVKKQLAAVLRYAIGIGLLAGVIWRCWGADGEGPGFVQALQRPIAIISLLLAAIAFLASILITYCRWYVLVRAQALPFTMSAAIRLGLIGFCFNIFLPGPVGGDFVKAAFIADVQDRRTVAVATVIVDRFVGLGGLFLMVASVGSAIWLAGWMGEIAIAASAAGYLEMMVLTAIGLVVSGIAAWCTAGLVSVDVAERLACRFQRLPMLGGIAAELWRALHTYRRNGKSIALALLLSVIGHMGFVLSFYFAACTLTPVDHIPTLLAHVLILPIATAIGAGFPSPGGVGGKELAISMLYELIGYTSAAGVLGALIQRGIMWALGLLGLMIYLGLPVIQRKRQRTI
ncbi:MAG TPA: lysylphosphatidylglycerol synthase transmembrane domain-containing protein [Gemmataceae bacterium]|nr:lysylphosphatidylglycerol synthase transmembrane domain-containing protein [Gemmataceae bacterium]